MATIQAVSVVVPVYKEKDNVETLITEIQKALTDVCTYEIIYVDDGSNDGTRQLLRSLSQSIPELSVVLHDGNFGQSVAVMTGVRAAQYDWVATLDGDGQNPPSNIPEMIRQLQLQDAPLALAAGIRVKRNDSRFKLFCSRVANNFRGWLLRDDCPDTGCGLKLFPKQTFLQVPQFNHIHRFLPALFRREGLPVINVPVTHRPRIQGQSKYGMFNRLWVGIVDLFGVAWLIARPSRARVVEGAD